MVFQSNLPPQENGFSIEIFIDELKPLVVEKIQFE